jgi:hypothetical protein
MRFTAPAGSAVPPPRPPRLSATGLLVHSETLPARVRRRPVFSLLCLASAHADRGQFHEAWRYIAEATRAVETTKEKWPEAELHRIAGEIALKSPETDALKEEKHFERALSLSPANNKPNPGNSAPP